MHLLKRKCLDLQKWEKNRSFAPKIKTLISKIMQNTILAKKLLSVFKTSEKPMLTTKEAAQYMGVSMSYLYKLTMLNQIPHYKPTGKLCFFNRLEIDEWLQRNRVSTDAELNQKAQAFCMKKGGVL